MNISDLSLNSSFYYPNNNELNFKLLQKNFYNFKKFFAKECSILYIVGPKGISKSLFLLFYCHLQNWAYSYPLLYINYKGMINLKYEGKKNIFKKEMVYLFFKENELINFYNEKVYEALKTKTLLKFIHDFLEHLLNIYKNTFKEEIIAVIDNFDEDDEDK